MTIFPKSFQYTFIAMIPIGIITSLVMHSIYNFDVEDVSRINITQISNLSIERKWHQKTEISRNEWHSIKRLIVNAESIWFTGWKGEPWVYFCTIRVYMLGDEKPYGFELATRKSMDGNVRIHLARGTSSSEWLYGSYDGNALLSYLQDNYPGECSAQAI